MKRRLIHTLLNSVLIGASVHAAGPPPNPTLFEQKASWTATPDVVEKYQKRNPDSNFVESKVPPWTLPPLLHFADGTEIKTPADWTRRRAELLEIFRAEMWGVSPPRPDGLTFKVIETNPRAMDGAATLKRMAVSFALGGETFTFHLTLFVPNQRPGPVPVFVLLNHRGVENTDPTRQQKSQFWPAEEVIARGYAIAAINVAAEVDPDNYEATKTQGVRAFYRKHHPQAAEFTWGTLAAWAWSGSRAVDYFLTDPDLDAPRIAVVGHSRTGKAALWAAAEDERFALACVNGAGEGGPALSRRDFGNKIVHLTGRNPHWFTPRYSHYAGREQELPMDGHQFIALDAPRRVNERVMPVLTDKAVRWIEQQQATTPFFLYFTPVAVHNPVTPDKDLAGKSAAGLYGDWIHELDRSVGRILEALDQQGFAKNTLVIFSSDNGGVTGSGRPGIPQAVAEQAGLKINGTLRGRKHSVWEGGFKVPFLVRWPERAPAGSVCHEMVSIADLLATTAAIVGEKLPDAGMAAEDRYNILPAILGEPTAPIRPDMIVHSSDGVYAIRKGPWKWIEGVPVDDTKPAVRKTRADEFRAQLYHTQDDPAETKDLSAQHPEVVAELRTLLNRYRDRGYSRAGN